MMRTIFNLKEVRAVVRTKTNAVWSSLWRLVLWLLLSFVSFKVLVMLGLACLVLTSHTLDLEFSSHCYQAFSLMYSSSNGLWTIIRKEEITYQELLFYKCSLSLLFQHGTWSLFYSLPIMAINRLEMLLSLSSTISVQMLDLLSFFCWFGIISLLSSRSSLVTCEQLVK